MHTHTKTQFYIHKYIIKYVNGNKFYYYFFNIYQLDCVVYIAHIKTEVKDFYLNFISFIVINNEFFIGVIYQ